MQQLLLWFRPSERGWEGRQGRQMHLKSSSWVMQSHCKPNKEVNPNNFNTVLHPHKAAAEYW